MANEVDIQITLEDDSIVRVKDATLDQVRLTLDFGGGDPRFKVLTIAEARQIALSLNAMADFQEAT